MSRAEVQKRIENLYKGIDEVLELLNGQVLDGERSEIKRGLERLMFLVKNNAEYREGMSHLDKAGLLEYEKLLITLYSKMVSLKGIISPVRFSWNVSDNIPPVRRPEFRPAPRREEIREEPEIKNLPYVDKLKIAIQYSEWASLIDDMKTFVVSLAACAVIFGILMLTPVDEAILLLTPIFVALGIASGIKTIIEGIFLLGDFLGRVKNAGSRETLYAAGQVFTQAVSKIGIGTLITLLSYFGGKKSKQELKVPENKSNIVSGTGKAIAAPSNRNGLRNAMGAKPFQNAQAHHGLPWNYKDWFANKGLNVNDPKFGAWVRGGGKGGHQSWSNTYNQVWQKFIADNPNATAAQIEQFFMMMRTDTRWDGGF